LQDILKTKTAILNSNTKPDHLENTSGCFRKLSEDELEFINNKKTQISYLKGETIFKQGAFSPHVLFVNQGLVRVYLQTGTNRQVNIRIAQKGDFIAFSSVFGENIYNYSSVALVDSAICMIDKDALKELLIRNPEFALEITSRNYKNEGRYIELIGNISYKQMRGKLASALLYLSGEEFADENLFQYLTRQDIADFASITIESGIKFLKEFEKEGILSIAGKDIVIHDRVTLTEVSRRG
jgi:CRP/FNR family transcriptional regulator